MTKQSGLGDGLLVAGYDLSGDIGSLSRIGGGPQPLDVTGINKSGFERIGGVRDGALSFQAWFNPTNNAAHDRFEDLPYTDQILTYLRGTTIGKPGACLNAKQINYDGTRGQDGSLTFAVEAQGNSYGLEWGRQLTAGLRVDTVATNGASIDLGSASPGAFGLQAYLQVTAFSGTDVTIRIQESSDDAVGDAFANVVGGAFTAVTSGPTTERIATGAINVERYLRVITSTSGGFTSVTFNVVAIRNDTLVAF